MDLVSIIMPAYNNGPFIREAIDSIISQTYTDWELLVVDDCSTDDTTSIVASFKDKRIHYQRNEYNMGAALSRNKAIQAAKGKYIAFLDADDKWLPTKLEKQVGFMQKNNIPMSYTAYYIQHPTHTDYCIHQCPTTQNYYQLTKWNRIGCLTVMYDREQIGTIQIPHIDKRNDYALWLTILRKGYTAHGIQEPLAIYRSHNGVSKGNKLAFLKYHYQMFHHILGYNNIIALLLTIRNTIYYLIFHLIDTK